MSIPAVRFRVDFRRDASVGPGKVALLEHIGACGSLSQAARELHMSYRRAWKRLLSWHGTPAPGRPESRNDTMAGFDEPYHGCREPA